MPKKPGKTRDRKPKRKQGKRTRKTNKKAAAAASPIIPAQVETQDSYLATTNADTDFVMVDKTSEETAAKMQDDPSKIVVGKIYAKWCGHCQSMSDDWDALEDRVDKKVYIVLNTEESEIPGRVDEINQIYLKDSDEKLVASGYPTIYRIENQQLKYYGGDRNTDAMYDWFVTQKGGIKKSAKKEETKTEKKGWFSWW